MNRSPTTSAARCGSWAGGSKRISSIAKQKDGADALLNAAALLDKKREQQFKDALKEKDRQIELLEQRVEALRKPRWSIPLSRRKNAKSGRPFVRVIIPDTHGCMIDEDAIGAVLRDIESLRPKEIVLLGDHLDCGGFLAQHHTMGYVAQTEYTFQEDVDATNDLLDKLQMTTGKADYHYLEGNHECLTADHQVLTKRGWIPIPDVTKDDVVATMSDSGVAEWDNPLATHSYYYSGDLICHGGPYYQTKMTPNHRVWYWSQNGKDLICRKAYRLLECNAAYQIPCSARNTSLEYEDVSDDELRLLGWILTDGCVRRDGIHIYQSKEHGIETIRGILSRLGLRFSEIERNREPGAGIATAKVQHVFRILAVDRKRLLAAWFPDNKKRVPEFVHNLSERQFDVFFESLIDGDGTRVGTAYTLYGRTEFLNEIQSILVVNGYRASLARRHRKSGSWFDCLNITKRPDVKIESRNLSLEKFSGNVYCLTMRNDNFFVRFNGRVSLTGNSRIEKWCVTQSLRNGLDAAFLLRQFGTNSQLRLAERGIEFYQQGQFYMGLRIPATIKLGPCYFTHGFTAAKHAAAKVLERYSSNVVFGHIHRSDEHSTSTIGSGTIKAWCPGCLCKLQPQWKNQDPTYWNHGYAIQLVQDDGFLHINVPVIDGKSYLIGLMQGKAI